jgi:cytochrome P450
MGHSDILEQLEDPLTPDMIYAQGVLFFSAGFETTSNALLTLSYNLARNPHVQVRLIILSENSDILG